MLEKDIEKKVCDYAKEKGMLVYKFTSPARRGVPDRLFVVNGGRIFFIEFKAPGKLLSPAQEREHYRLAQHGVDVYTTDNTVEGCAIIDMEIVTHAKS